MELNHHTPDTMPGALLTVTLLLLSVSLDVFSAVSGVDKTVLQPLLHLVQMGAALTAVVVGICTVSPKFKHRLQKLFNL